MKKGKSIYRLKGPVSKRDEMMDRAMSIIVDLENGWVPTKKSETLK